jgi:hypothetical protein
MDRYLSKDIEYDFLWHIYQYLFRYKVEKSKSQVQKSFKEEITFLRCFSIPSEQPHHIIQQKYSDLGITLNVINHNSALISTYFCWHTHRAITIENFYRSYIPLLYFPLK